MVSAHKNPCQRSSAWRGDARSKRRITFSHWGFSDTNSRGTSRCMLFYFDHMEDLPRILEAT
jgi:hypothetical protein